jgi:hypothetical protein
MRSEYPARAPAAAARAEPDARNRTILETALAISGFAAWIWCAWEIVKAFWL